MKRPSHATVIAYLALFVALSSGAYAATQLPKNSVGAKQLKKKAVTTTKLKDGVVTTPKLKDGAVTTAKIADNAVTGAKVDEASLGQVPSAAVAGSATSAATAASATSAANASALDGIASGGFLQTKDVFFGTASVETATVLPLFTVPGMFRVTTVGDAADEFKVRIENLSPSMWVFFTETALIAIPPATSTPVNLFSATSIFQRTVVGIDTVNEANHAVIQCAFRSSTPSLVSCMARVSPAA